MWLTLPCPVLLKHTHFAPASLAAPRSVPMLFVADSDSVTTTDFVDVRRGNVIGRGWPSQPAGVHVSLWPPVPPNRADLAPCQRARTHTRTRF